MPGTNTSAVPGFSFNADIHFIPSFGTWSWNDQQSSVAFLMAGGKDGVATDSSYQGGKYFKAKESVHRVYGKHCS